MAGSCLKSPVGRMRQSACILFAALMLAGEGVQAAGDGLFSVMSSAMMVREGKNDYLDELRKLQQLNLLDRDKAGLERAKLIARKLLTAAVRRNPASDAWDWELHLVRSDDFNAFCYPGGKMLIYDRVLAAFPDDDAAVAFVLGHEISHALLEHSRAEQGEKFYRTGLHWLLTRSFRVGRLGDELLGMGERVTQALPMSRQQELEADVSGMQLMAAAGFDPGGAVRAAERMFEISPGKAAASDLFKTHPLDAHRLAMIRQQLPAVRKDYVRVGVKER